jgi:hypothetical protein
MAYLGPAEMDEWKDEETVHSSCWPEVATHTNVTDCDMWEKTGRKQERHTGDT